jgi:hypothetical protein
VGTVVLVEIEEDIYTILITGKRQVKKYKNGYGDDFIYQAFDYIGVPIPNGVDEGVFHFNHLDIVEIVHEPPFGLYTQK